MKKLLFLFVSATFIFSGCGGADEPLDDENVNETGDQGQAAEDGGTVDVAAAKEIYVNSSCIACHGENLQGVSGPAIHDVGSRRSKEEILNIIHNGQGQMPGGMLQGQDAEIVAAWLASLK
jgi:cytochrome c551